MKDYDPLSSFDPTSAKRHDHRGDEGEAVSCLVDLADGGPVLELGVGTGRLAIPLAEHGLRVDGIDFSLPMLTRLRSKPGGERIRCVLGNFAEVKVKARYRLIFVAWNTLFNLLTQDDQIRCFENVADHLTPEGRFLVEAYVPSFLHHYRDAQSVEVESIETSEVMLGVLRHEVASQTLDQTHIALSQHGVELTPVVQRYAWPSELDLMARLAGLELEARWGNWRRGTFDSTSDFHVSVYGRSSSG